ncbi:hypothetical protein Pcinc_009978 [Petrolisthes cinctipes]|uniref:Uncharacterized protein n=1 Tax=Petrolisthes cinctipes TaxID=88211 RepID=A0AAE1G5Q6_PETCI|nr:hypothetical protein Pcinc_009978 [Petrolisthes cinctipes]
MTRGRPHKEEDNHYHSTGTKVYLTSRVCVCVDRGGTVRRATNKSQMREKREEQEERRTRGEKNKRREEQEERRTRGEKNKRSDEHKQPG